MTFITFMIINPQDPTEPLKAFHDINPKYNINDF